MINKKLMNDVEVERDNARARSSFDFADQSEREGRLERNNSVAVASLFSARAREREKETSVRETTMMTTGDGELFSEDGWPVRAEIKKTAPCSQRGDPNRIRLGQKAR